jgi:uncharacterized protein YjbJ (UPF0337 family)
MKPSTRNRTRGVVKQTKGKAKQAVGRLTRNRRLAAEGKIQDTVGRVQRKFGEAQQEEE